MERLPYVGVNPDYGLSKTTSYRVKRDSFGDGYELRAKEVINQKASAYNLKWSGLTEAQKQVLEDFFDERGNVEAFLWDQMGQGDMRLVGVSDLKVTYDEYEDYTVSIEVKQDFGMHI